MYDTKDTLSRRRFGQLALAGLASTGLAGCSGAKGPTGKLSKIGVQIYTLREAFVPDALPMLKLIAETGYDEVELFGRGLPEGGASVLKDALNDLGLTAPSMHFRLGDLQNKLPESIDYMHAIGGQYVALPSLPAEYKNAEGYAEIAKFLNEIAVTLKGEGLGLVYHNHAFEFEPVGTTNGYEIITSQTDPELVGLEIDLHWATRGKQNIFDMLEKHAGRVWMFHVKDINAAGDEIMLAGDGVIDFPAIFAKAEAAGVKHYFLEQDNMRLEDYESSLIRAHDYLRGLRF